MKRRFITLLMAFVMLMSLLPMSALAENTGNDLNDVDTSAATEEVNVATDSTSDGSLTVLAFTSDTHNKPGNTAANRLGSWLDKVESIYGKKVDVMSFGGDMAGAGASGYWDLTQADMYQLEDREIEGVYTTGNHEISYGGNFN